MIHDYGIVTAYGYAKSKGYAGTEEEFAELLAHQAETAAAAAASAEAAAGFAGDAAEAVQSIQGKTAQIDANTDAIADLNYKPVDITAFSASPNQVEIGATVTEVTLSWEINKTPDTLALNGVEISDPPASGSETKTGSFTTRQEWTLDATDTGSPSHAPASDRATATLDFLSKVYWGCGSESAFSGDQDAKDAFINGLTGVLATRRQRTVLFTPSGSQYLYFAIPSSLCTGINFIVRSGSGAGFGLAYNTLETEWSHKNNTPAQTAVAYNVYRSTNSFSSAISIEIT